MQGTRYALIAGLAALGLAAAPAMAGEGCCASKTDAAAKAVSAKAVPAKADATVQTVAAKADGQCAVKAAPASFTVRANNVMRQAANDGKLVMVAVYGDAKQCPVTAAKLQQASDGAKQCPVTAAKLTQAADTKECASKATTAAMVTQAADTKQCASKATTAAMVVQASDAKECATKATGATMVLASDAKECGDKAGCEAIKAAHRQFITLQVNPSECAESKAFAAKYRVTSYPTTLFLDAKGTEVHRVAGTVAPDKLATEMNAALTKAGKTKTASTARG